MSIDVLFVFVMQCRVLTSLCRCSLRVVCCVLCVIGVLVIAVMCWLVLGVVDDVVGVPHCFLLCFVCSSLSVDCSMCVVLVRCSLMLLL